MGSPVHSKYGANKFVILHLVGASFNMESHSDKNCEISKISTLFFGKLFRANFLQLFL